MANRYQFTTTLINFVNVYEDSGNFNNRGFQFIVPDDIIQKLEVDREEDLSWAKTKAPNPNRVEVALPKWDDTGLIKYSYGGQTKRQEPVFVDSTGVPIEKSVLKDLRKGTKVNILCQQSPYVYGAKVGTKFFVAGVQIIELATGNGAVDSGALSVDEVAGRFGVVKGYSQADPAVRKEEAVVGDGDAYDF